MIQVTMFESMMVSTHMFWFSLQE